MLVDLQKFENWLKVDLHFKFLYFEKYKEFLCLKFLGIIHRIGYEWWKGELLIGRLH